MDIKERQQREKNRITLILGSVIIGYSTLIAVLGFADKTADMAVVAPRAVGCLVTLAAFLFCYFKFRDDEKAGYLCMGCIMLNYAITVLTQRNIYMYALVFPIMLLAILYQNMKVTRILMISSILLNLIAGIKNFIIYPDTQSQSFMQILYTIVFCIAIDIIVRMLIKHTDEDQEHIISQMNKAERVAGELLKDSEQLVNSLDAAKEKAQLLTDSMHTTETSVSEISTGIKNTAQAIDTQTARTNEIQKNIDNAENETKEMKNSAQESKQAIIEGVDLILELREKAEAASEITRKTKENTEELDNSIKEVESILSTILGISQQTNLLSLNASIEAARAGEAGKGFAVVADEIRNLSDETKAATEQIANIIGRLTDSVKEASDNMGKSASFVEEQHTMIDDTKAKFDTVIDKTQFLYDTIENLANEIDEILHSNEQITDSIINLSATSQQVAASSDSCEAVCQDSVNVLEQMNEVLNEIFEISENIKRLV